MSSRTWARLLIAVSLSISGLVETLGATGLVMELSPDGGLGAGIHTLAVSGPLQFVGAIVVASGRKTRWALIILMCYTLLVSAFGDLPLIFNPEVSGSALISLLANVAVMGGILYWFQSERVPGAQSEGVSVPIANHRPDLLFGLMLCLVMMGAVFCWLHSGRIPSTHKVIRATPPLRDSLALPMKLLI